MPFVLTVLSKLHNDVQRLRENGESDLRIVLLYIEQMMADLEEA